MVYFSSIWANLMISHKLVINDNYEGFSGSQDFEASAGTSVGDHKVGTINILG